MDNRNLPQTNSSNQQPDLSATIQLKKLMMNFKQALSDLLNDQTLNSILKSNKNTREAHGELSRFLATEESNVSVKLYKKLNAVITLAKNDGKKPLLSSTVTHNEFVIRLEKIMQTYSLDKCLQAGENDSKVLEKYMFDLYSSMGVFKAETISVEQLKEEMKRIKQQAEEREKELSQVNEKLNDTIKEKEEKIEELNKSVLDLTSQLEATFNQSFSIDSSHRKNQSHRRHNKESRSYSSDENKVKFATSPAKFEAIRLLNAYYHNLEKETGKDDIADKVIVLIHNLLDCDNNPEKTVRDVISEAIKSIQNDTSFNVNQKCSELIEQLYSVLKKVTEINDEPNPKCTTLADRAKTIYQLIRPQNREGRWLPTSKYDEAFSVKHAEIYKNINNKKSQSHQSMFDRRDKRPSNKENRDKGLNCSSNLRIV